MRARPAGTPNRAAPQHTPPNPITRSPPPPGGMAPIPGNPLNNQGPPQNNHKKYHRMKVNIKIVSLNLNGAAAPSDNMTHKMKWNEISRTLYRENIAILAAQETHLDQQRTENLQTKYKKNLEIRVLEHPENPRRKAGVAFIINKKII